jgi:hypothetical protein
MSIWYLSILQRREGRATARAVSRHPLTAEARIRALDKLAMGYIFLEYFGFPPSA